jgi:hypothetical protein
LDIRDVNCVTSVGKNLSVPWMVLKSIGKTYLGHEWQTVMMVNYTGQESTGRYFCDCNFDFEKGYGNVFWEKHMVTIDGLNMFDLIMIFEYYWFIVFRLFMRGVLHHHLRLSYLLFRSWEHIMMIKCFWKVIMYHENYLYKSYTCHAQGPTEILSHTILFIYFRFWLEDL